MYKPLKINSDSIEKFYWDVYGPPKVGITITHYNYSDFVESAIVSVLNQICHNYESIVVDDFSYQDNREILH